MSVNTLGRLESVDLRTIWNSEASDFTPWLAQENNLTLLGETIGLDLELEGTEKNVGPFRADIVCKDTVTDAWVLIENQLERTDHSHLGQLLTYAAGLNAVTIVWIADRFTEEHRAMLDWLNEITDESINFFGLEIELWRIGHSDIAPKFNIASKPNDWTKTIVASRRNSEITPTKQLQLEYWQAFREHLENNSSIINAQKPRAQHWMNISVGRSGFHMASVTNTRENRIGVQLLISKGDIGAFFHLLSEDKEAIEAEIGHSLEWRELPHRKRSDISLYNTDVDPNDRDAWPQQHEWLQKTLESFYRSFSPRIKALDSDDFIADEPLDDEEILNSELAVSATEEMA